LRFAGLRGVAFWALLIGLLLLAAGLVWHDLAAHEVLGRDENVTIVKLDQPDLNTVLDASRLKFTGQPSNTQPLYFLLQHLFWPLVGRSTFMLRFLSSLFGVLTVVLTYKLGEVLFGREAGLIGGLLTALLMLHVQYSQIARPYTLLAALSLASAYLLALALRTSRFVHWAGFVVIATLNFYNHFNALFVLAAEGMFAAVVWLATLVGVLRRRQSARRLIGPVLGFLLVGILCAPGLIRLSGLPWVGLEGEAGTGGQIAIELSPSFFRHYMYEIGLSTEWLQNLIVALMGLGLVGSLYRRRWQAALLSAIWVSLPFIVLSVMKSPRPFETRYLIFVPPVALLLAGQGVVVGVDLLSKLGRPWSVRGLRWAAIIALSAGLALLVAKPLNSYYAANRTADRLNQTMEVVERQARSGDVIVISPRSFIRPLAVEGADVLYLREHLSPAELDDLASRYQRMWILHTSFIPPAELQEPLDQWVQAKPDLLVRVPIKAVNVLTFGIVSPSDPEAVLKDSITVMEDFAQSPSGRHETWVRYNLLADAYQALGDYYASQGEATLAAEYRDKAEEARTAAPPPQ
jgi:4-amino-4-deoxy-L-arabinose transferase-like glycosyltransferase